jgi:hypothetical protein
MAKSSLEDRIVFVHRIKQLVEVDENPRVARIQGALIDAESPGSNLPVFTIFSLDLKANFLLFRKYHVDNAGACQSYYKICVCVIFSTMSLSLAYTCLLSIHMQERVIFVHNHNPFARAHHC